MIPNNLSVLIELFLYLDDLPDDSRPDYSEMIKKLKIAQENIILSEH